MYKLPIKINYKHFKIFLFLQRFLQIKKSYRSLKSKNIQTHFWKYNLTALWCLLVYVTLYMLTCLSERVARRHLLAGGLMVVMSITGSLTGNECFKSPVLQLHRFTVRALWWCPTTNLSLPYGSSVKRVRAGAYEPQLFTSSLVYKTVSTFNTKWSLGLC